MSRNATIIIIVILILLIGGIGIFLNLDRDSEELPDNGPLPVNGTNGNNEPISEEPIAERTVNLFYYNPARDQDSTGNIMCTRAGLQAVERTITSTRTPIQDTIRTLLRGELTAAERAAGITTEFPLAGVSLEAASLRDGVLTLTMRDTQNRTSGGSCRAGILWYQIEATALQFDEVNSVRFAPEDELFQP
jgi:spore germination protein GerM